jgi:alpha-1,2-rhamnosyltransferase
MRAALSPLEPLARVLGVSWAGLLLRKILFPRKLVRKARRLRVSWSSQEIVPGSGDAVVLLDNWWNPDVWPLVSRAKSNGAKIDVVVYDLLPVTHPEYFRRRLTDRFATCLNLALEQGDRFLAISRHTCDALKEHAAARHVRTGDAAAFQSFRLGSQLDRVSHQGKVRTALARVFHGSDGIRPYLTVGTLEPRKNHVLLLDAFERVWRERPQTRLLIVGRFGWMSNDLVKRILHHPQYSRSLFLFTNLVDSELEYCYRNSQAFIFPSHAEGFGLPIVEALQHGLPVMASDIPIHREVVGDFCAYFDQHNPSSLAGLIDEFEQLGTLAGVRQASEYRSCDWSTSTQELLQKCLAK